MTKRRSKYGNRKVTAYGKTFDSVLEYQRYVFLRSMQDQGKIRELQTQVRKQLSAYGKPICVYIADFEYRLLNGARITEDAKGMLTDTFRIKRKLYEAMTDQPINIVTKSNLTSLPDA